MKLQKRVVPILLIICMLISFALGCKGKDEESDPYAPVERADDFSYYPKTVMNKDKRLYVFGQGMNKQELITAQAIQGLFAREEVTFYLNNSSNTQAWLTDLTDNYGLTSVETSLEGMLGMYKERFGEDSGYILYDKNSTQSVNVACTVSGVTGHIPVDASLAETVDAAEIAVKLDVSDKTERWCFDNYKDRLDNRYLVQLRGDIEHLRDFGIANKLLFFYQDAVSSAVINFRGEIHGWARADAPIFGWGPGSEDSHVGIATMHSQFTIPSDYCFNMTVFGARDYYNLKSFVTPNENTPVKVADKHYVCFVRSDGDNIQTWFNTFPFSQNDMGAERGSFPMGWSVQPSLTDIAPTILDYVYRNAKSNDYFVAAVSGMGYMYPNTYPKLAEFTGSLDVYLNRSGLNLVQILDSGPSDKVVEYYSRIPSLKGGIYAYGDKYMGGHGSVFWSSNGKPFVSFRESMWSVSNDYMVGRINSFEVNPTDISGYSLINLHPWSMSYKDIVSVVNKLGDHVQVVSPEQFFDLIIANVPKVNKSLTA